MTTAEKRRLRKGLAFVSPWFIGLGLFMLYPIVASLYFSFCEYSVLQKPVWIGVGNYQDLFTDSVFWKTLGNTVVYAAVALPLGLVVSLSLALLLNTGVKGLAVFRTIMFLPALVPMVALAIVWLWIFNGQYGLLNNLAKSDVVPVCLQGILALVAGVAFAYGVSRVLRALAGFPRGAAGALGAVAGLGLMFVLLPVVGPLGRALQPTLDLLVPSGAGRRIYWLVYLGYSLPVAGVVAFWAYDRLSLRWGAAMAWLSGLLACGVGVAVVALLHPEAGLLSFVIAEPFAALADAAPGWLADPNWSKTALVVMSLWGGGNAMVIYLAGLQDVPQHLYDAAELDGANWLQKIRHVALPAISPVILFNVIMGIIGSLQFFAVPYVISPTGSPDRSIYFLTMYLYDNAFTYLRMGYASAMAWILFIIIFALTLISLKLSKRFVHYEGN